MVREIFKKEKKENERAGERNLHWRNFFSVKDTKKPGCRAHGEETGSFYQSVKESVQYGRETRISDILRKTFHDINVCIELYKIFSCLENKGS